MTRKRNWLISIGEAFGSLDGPVKAIRDAARESDPDLGFQARHPLVLAIHQEENHA